MVVDGEASGAAVAIVCAAAALYFLFGAPVPCGAPTRDHDGCRNNSYGIVRGCRIRQHRWRNVTAMIHKKWGQAFAGMMTGPAQKVATLGLVVSLSSLVVGVVT